MPPELPKPLNKFMNENRSGNQILKLDARGDAITYAYDVLNRQSGKLYPNGTLVTFGYDVVNRQTQMQDIPTGRTTYLYDLQGRLIGYQPGLSQVALSYSYDGADNRTALSEAAAGRFTSFVYDPANNLTQILNSYGERTTFVYDALNREKTSVRADNVLVSQSYDGNGEMISQENTALSIFLTTFSYDPAGNRTGMDQFFPPSKNINAAYSYDPANQLLGEVTEPSGGASGHGYISTYAYDGSGNWTTRLEEIAFVSPFSRQYTTTYAHDNAGELTGNSAAWTGYPTGGSGASAATYTYDAAGNRLTANVGGVVTTYSWDYENRLIGATFSPLATLTSGILTNLYSSDGLRQGYADHTGITTLTYDILSQNVYRRDVLSTAATERYTNRPEAYGSPISICRVAAATGAIVTNLFYNSVDGTDNISSLAAAGDNATAGNYVLYPAFGAGSATVPTIPSPLSTQPFQYMGAAGYYTDPSTGLIYVKARWYDPLTGIWLSEDPIGFDGGDWSSLYRYVGNKPLMDDDPNGKSPAYSPSCSPPDTLDWPWWLPVPISDIPTPTGAHGNKAGSPGCWGGGKSVYITRYPGTATKNTAVYCLPYQDCGEPCGELCKKQGEKLGTPVVPYGSHVLITKPDGSAPPFRASRTVNDCGCGQKVKNKPDPDNWMDISGSGSDGWYCIY
jgi:RHS repeat-associated protein